GAMSAEEVADFAQNPNLEAIVQVRIWDDEGKVKDKITPDFDYYAPMLRRVVDAHSDT
ncbi:MAG: putative HD phosphohydrolase, partial [Planctomycetota bacterium]